MKLTHSLFAVTGLLTVFGTLLASAPASAQSFYGVTYFDGQFLSVDGTSGAATQTGSLNGGVQADGLASYNGSYYTFDTATNSLLELNPATGATLSSVGVGISGSVAPGGLAISQSGLAFLAVPLTSSPQNAPASTLYAFNLMGGGAVNVGTTNDLLSSLAFGPNDTLYGLGKGDGQLYTINTANASGTLIGNLGNLTVSDPLDPSGSTTLPIDSDPIAALAFSGSSLYAAADGNLYSVDTTTGAATIVNASLANSGFGGGFSSVSGLASAPAVPETSSVVSFGVLLSLGGVFLLRRRKSSAL